MSSPTDDVPPPSRVRPTQIVADEAWDWVNEVGAAPEVDVSDQRVIAILVSHNAASWLDQTLDSLRNLTVGPERYIAADTGSTDTSLGILRDSGLFAIGVVAGPDDSFGQAVDQALATFTEGHPQRAIAQIDEWLWLLHDDITVDPEALRHLLECAVHHPDADVIGPKLLQPGRVAGPRRISELGVTISDTARMDYHLEPGEIDQQQHTSTETLGVNTCGMLVRRTVFEALGGLAPEVPVFRDGVEFGWRATAAGYRVRTCPEAVITHRRAGYSGLRRAHLIDDPHATDRLMGMRTVAAHRGPLVRLRLIVGSLLRTLGYLLAKAPDLARAELSALRRFFDNRPIKALRARVNPSVSDQAAARVRALRPPWWSSITVVGDTVAGAFADRWQRSQDAGTSIDELTGDEFAAATDRAHRSALTNPVVITVLVLVIAGLIAARGLIRPGLLASDVLLPARARLGDTYTAYLAPIIGAPGIDPPPWLGWTALASTLTFGQPGWLVTLLFLAGVPLAFWSALLLTRRVVRDRRLQVVSAVGYALLPVLLGAVNRGLLEVMVVAVVLPLIGLAIRGLVSHRPGAAETWRSAWSLGLLLAITLAFAPVLSALVVLAAIAALIGWRRNRARLARLWVAIAVPMVLLAPWLPSVARNWSRLLVGPDAGLRGLLSGEVWALLFGRTPGVGLPWWWLSIVFFGIVWVLALLGVFRRPGRVGIWGAWGVALAALALAALLGGQLATVLPQGTRVRPDTEVVLLVMFAALVLAGGLGLGSVTDSLTRRDIGIAHLGIGAVAVVTVFAVLAGVIWWAVAGASGPLRRTELAELPPFIRNAMTSPAATRTLVMVFDPDTPETADAPRWTLVAGDQTRLGDADRGLAFGGSGSIQQRTASMVSRLVSGAGDERVADDLATLAVSHLWVHGATEEQQARINNTPGLGAAAVLGDTVVWTVDATTARYAITGGGEPVVVPAAAFGGGTLELPTADHARVLTIHEPTDPRWRVRLDGAELPLQTAADRTTAQIPNSGGLLEIDIPASGHRWLALAQLVVLVVVIVLAAPGLRRTQSELGEVAARGVRQVEEGR